MVLEVRPSCGVAGEEKLGVGHPEELGGMQQHVPILHGRSYWGCGEVLPGPEEVPRGHPARGLVKPREGQQEEPWEGQMVPRVARAETSAGCASSHWYPCQASSPPPRKAPVRVPAMVKSYPPPQEHPPRMLPGMAIAGGAGDGDRGGDWDRG